MKEILNKKDTKKLLMASKYIIQGCGDENDFGKVIVQSGMRCAADFCLQIIKSGGITGMVNSKVKHVMSNEGTKEKQEWNYFAPSRYIANKHKDLIKLNKQSRFLFVNKKDNPKNIKYKIINCIILEN